MKNNAVRTAVAVGIGSALFFVLGRYVAIPSPVPNTNISIQYGLLAFMAALFGPVAGALIGLIGHTLIDFSYGWGIWWSWVIASACFGALTGFTAKGLNLADGVFEAKGIIMFNVFQAISHAVAWLVIAPVLDILIYAEPANKVFAQGLFGGISNIITTAVVGTILCVAYASSRPKKGSLKMDQ
ncbi:MAG: ECF-type riboflavin transporter substrate-binding protein [Clostridia bacterium]|nr:ECF-type riboflavin transporter substrate-binding protein [Clostridia bacterium]